MATAIAQPKVITIQPEFSALEFLSSTPATTPSPRMIRIMVPMNSPIYASIYPSSLERSAGRDVARRPEVVLHLVHYLVGRFHLFALHTRLAVDTYTDLHLVVGDVEDGLAALGRGAARERHSHRTDVAVDPLCQLLDAGKIPAVVRGGAADLVY